MAEPEKGFRIRDELIEKIFVKIYKVLRDEVTNPEIQPPISMEEHKVIIGRFQDIYLQQQMELYNTYFFEENIKPLFEGILDIVKTSLHIAKPEDKKPPTDLYL